MKVKTRSIRSNYYIYLVLIIFVLVLIFITERQHSPFTKSTPSVTKSLTAETKLLVDVAVWYPSAPWSEPTADSDQTLYGELTGESIKAQVTSDTATLPHFEIVNELIQMGFASDNNLSADGPGSSTWGYKKIENGKTQVIIFAYRTIPTNANPDEPLQFNCPCKIDIEAFVSKPFSATTN